MAITLDETGFKVDGVLKIGVDVVSQINTKADKVGDNTQTFKVANAVNQDEAVSKAQMDAEIAAKADLGGNSSQAFKVADAVNADEAVSKQQLEDRLTDIALPDIDLSFKADLNGDIAQTFKVANAINSEEAINKGQLLAEIKEIDGSDSGLDADTVDGLHADDFVLKTDYTGGASSVIVTPTITSPVDGATDFNDVIASSIYTPSDNFYGAHQATDWEVSTDSTFATVGISSYDDTNDLTSFQMYAFTPLTTYYTRVRYKSDNHISEWSAPTSFTTSDAYIETPTVTVDGEPDQVSATPYIYGSAYNNVNGSEAHVSTDWVVKDGTGTVIWSSLGDTTNLTSIQIPGGVLLEDTTYTFEVTYRNTSYASGTGAKSASTKASFIPADEIAILLSSDGAENDHFGASVAINSTGDTAIVGAYYADTANSHQGKAYIYKFDGTDWTEQAILTSSDGAASDYFGYSVSINSTGDTAIVGAYYADTANSRQGKAYIYKFDGTNWVEQTILTSSDGDDTDFFGHSVSISSTGDTAIVGAHLADTANSRQGKAYIYKFDGTNWVEQVILTASEGVASDNFGGAVSINSTGDTVIVGAINADTPNTNQGKAYIYKFDGTDWIEQDTLMASDGAENDYFGSSVAINSTGDTAIVGARSADTVNSNQGKAYIYKLNSISWVEQAILISPYGVASDNFGYSVAINSTGDIVIVGATGANSSQGKAYIYKFDGTDWEYPEAILTSSDGDNTDFFGHSVSISSTGDTAIVGAHFADTANSRQGKAYIFG